MDRPGWIAGVRTAAIPLTLLPLLRSDGEPRRTLCLRGTFCRVGSHLFGAAHVISKRTPTVSGTRAGRGPRIGRPRASRTQIMARISEVLREREASPLRLADLCEVTGVSERTLRTMFVEQFGVGPKRYLRTRKLHAVRAALAVADPARETVSGIARRFGLSDIGRMAKDYSELFGEYPRVTLMRKPRGAGKAYYAKPVG
jgi:AraC-like DNA-binding protein